MLKLCVYLCLNFVCIYSHHILKAIIKMKNIFIIFYRYYPHPKYEEHIQRNNNTIQKRTSQSVICNQRRHNLSLIHWQTSMTGALWWSHWTLATFLSQRHWTRTVFIVWTYIYKDIHLHNLSLNEVFSWRMRI